MCRECARRLDRSDPDACGVVLCHPCYYDDSGPRERSR